MATVRNKGNKTKNVVTKSQKKDVTVDTEKNVNNENVNEVEKFEFDEVKALEDAIKNMEQDIPNDIELPEIAQEALKEVKNAAKVTEKIDTSNVDFSKEKISETLDKLNEIERKLDDDIAKKISSLTDKQKNTLSKSKLFDFGTFWSGISNGWD